MYFSKIRRRAIRRNKFLCIAARLGLAFTVGMTPFLFVGCRRASQQDVYYENGKRIAKPASVERKDGQQVAHLVDNTMRLHLSSQKEQM